MAGQEDVSRGQQRSNIHLNHSSDRGGSVRVTIPATPFAVQANAGTSRPCTECWIIAAAANTSECRVQIGAACTATTGIPIPKTVAHGSDGSSVPLRVPAKNVNLLYFIGATQNDVVDILWRN
jgi:hypothetical protein